MDARPTPPCQAREPTRRHVHIAWIAVRPREHQVEIGSVAVPPSPPLELLISQVTTQHRDRQIIQVDGPPCVSAGLQRDEPRAGVTVSRPLLAHPQPCPVEVQVTAAKTEQLVPPHSRSKRDVTQTMLAQSATYARND